MPMPKTINDIIPPSRRRQMTEGGGDSTPPPFEAPRRGGSRFPWGLVIAVIVIIGASIGALYAFAGARVEITPTAAQATVAADMTATQSTGELPYEIVTVDKVGSKTVPAESTQQVDEAAQGTITAYNTEDTTQRFVKNTRFESPEGLIFKAYDAIVIPPGSAVAPGTAEVAVYAEAAGDKYNIGPTSFTLPGLAGSDTFDLVSGRSTEAMQGGFSGNRPTVSQATKDREYEAMKAGLERDLREAINAEIPEGYTLVPGATFISYQPQADGVNSAGSVDLRLKGTIRAVVFPNEALAKAVAYQTLGVYTGEPVMLPDVTGLSLTPVAEPSEGTFAFNLSGSTQIVWKVDGDKIAGAVAGKKRNAAQTILSGFTEVEKAVLILRPFWAGTFPEDPAEIEVVVKEPAN